MESGKSLHLHVCGNASLQEDMKGHSVVPAVTYCLKRDETSILHNGG